MNKKSLISLSILTLIILLGAFLRFYNLDYLPMEMYGDIIEGYKFTEEILTGKWPFYFVLGNGPLFFYLVSILAKIIGLSFLTMKITSSLVGIAIIFTTYLLGKEVFDEETGLIAAFLMAVSKWPLIFSRLGNMPILVTLFSSVIFYFTFKISRKSNKWLDWILLAVLLGLGFYIYPAFFILPLAVFVFFIFQGISFIKNNLIHELVLGLIFLLCAFPFGKILMKNPASWFGSSSYFGSKIFVTEGKVASDWPIRFVTNVRKTVLMFFTNGDPGFRSNPPGQPAIDILSRLFLLTGIAFGFIDRKNRKNTFLLIQSSFLVMLPSILVLNVPSDVPNMGRTVGVIPLIFLLVANGLIAPCRISFVKKFLSNNIRYLILILLLTIILRLNFIHYFRDYSYHLPNHNEGFPRLIAEEIDKLPQKTNIIMVDSNWADWGQPDWRAVYYEMKSKKTFKYFENKDFTCQLNDNIQSKYFILNPTSNVNLKMIENCLPGGNILIHYSPKYKFPVFISYYLGQPK